MGIGILNLYSLILLDRAGSLGRMAESWTLGGAE
jgi:hypothetical protein